MLARHATQQDVVMVMQSFRGNFMKLMIYLMNQPERYLILLARQL